MLLVIELPVTQLAAFYPDHCCLSKCAIDRSPSHPSLFFVSLSRPLSLLP
jgi:hypothetical protein